MYIGDARDSPRPLSVRSISFAPARPTHWQTCSTTSGGRRKRRAKGISKSKRLCGNGDDDRLRAVTIQLLGAGEQPGGRATVGKR